MVVDTSAIVAVLNQEPEADTFSRAISESPIRLLSAVSLLECGMLARARKGDPGVFELDAFIVAAELDVIPFDADQAYVARDAFDRFGKGRHPAGLNFGDCAVYALAATRAEPLLFKGRDFALTDLPSAEISH
jgi:ribonuclease VapC